MGPAFKLNNGRTSRSDLMKSLTFVMLLALSSSACVTVRPVAAPASFIPQTKPELVWVQHQDGESFPLSRPTMRGDTLAGQRLDTAEPVRLALPRVASISARQPDRTRTALLVAGAAALAGLFVWRASGKGGGSASYCFLGYDGAFHCVN
jgi:hypothetical protein